MPKRSCSAGYRHSPGCSCGWHWSKSGEPAELFYDNYMMSTQLIHAAYQAGVEKFVCLGTIGAYPTIDGYRQQAEK